MSTPPTYPRIAIIPLNIHIEDGAEIPFAGHPTVGSGFFCARRYPGRAIVLRPLAGDMPVARVLDASGALTGARVNVAVDFKDHGALAIPQLAAMQPTLASEDYIGRADLATEGAAYPVASIVKGMSFVLVELASLDALARVQPFATRARPADGALGEWEGLVGVYLFVREGEEGNVVNLRTRMIHGPLEDPGKFDSDSVVAAHGPS